MLNYPVAKSIVALLSETSCGTPSAKRQRPYDSLTLLKPGLQKNHLQHLHHFALFPSFLPSLLTYLLTYLLTLTFSVTFLAYFLRSKKPPACPIASSLRRFAVWRPDDIIYLALDGELVRGLWKSEDIFRNE